MIQYAVIDDYGDEPYTGNAAFVADSLYECQEWAEDQNYHSASIVLIDGGGVRTVVR